MFPDNSKSEEIGLTCRAKVNNLKSTTEKEMDGLM